MSRRVIAWLGAAGAALFLVLGVTGPVSAAAEPTLTVATDPSFVPFESMDIKTHKMVGFDMDIIRHIGKEAGFKVKLRTMNFNGIIPALQAHSVAIAIAGITITKQRAKKIDYSIPYYDSGLRIMVRSNNHDITKLSDLEGKRISTKIGSTSYDYLHKNVPHAKAIVPYPGTDQMYMAVMSGNVDAALYDAPNVLYFVKTKGHGRVKAVGPLYEGQQYGIAFPKGSKWVAPVNKALKTMYKNGSYTKIYKKWFGENPPKDILSQG